MASLPEEPEWYLDNVLFIAAPGGPGPTAPLGPIAVWRDTWQRRADAWQRDAASDAEIATPARTPTSAGSAALAGTPTSAKAATSAGTPASAKAATSAGTPTSAEATASAGAAPSARTAEAGSLRATACRQGFVLTTAELTAAGWTRSATRAALRRGQWWSPARGVVAPLRPDGLGSEHMTLRSRHALAAAGLWRARPDHTVAACSAAILHGVPVLRVPDEPQLLAPERLGLGRRSPGHAFGAASPKTR